MAKRGRPKGRPTTDMHILLYVEQKAQLEFLSGHLPGNPPLSGLVREAVAEYVGKMLQDDRLADAYRENGHSLQILV